MDAAYVIEPEAVVLVGESAAEKTLTMGPLGYSVEYKVKVLGLTNGLIATTSTGESVNGKPANFKLRIWDPSTGKQVGDDIQDHAGSIRCIAPLPAIDGFATTSNDGAVILRTIEGQPIEVMTHPETEDGTAAFVFGCCALETEGGMEIVSCAEDGSVLVWRDGELIQSLRHPCCVWAVKPLAGGDFLTCGDDGFLRIFSRDPLKTSSTQVAQLNEEFQLEVDEAQRKRHKGPSAEEIAKAPKWEHRGTTPGRSADQVMVFNKDGEIIAAQWISGSWVIVGTVTGSGDGGYVKEVWYDHVMPVEIEGPNGVMALKLGHNNGENPFVAAQRFIDQNDMSQSYLNQIADWITARSGQTQPTLGGGGGGAQSAARNASSAGSSSAASTVPVAAPRVFTFKVVSLTTFDDVPPMTKLLSKVTEFSNAQTDPSWTVDVGHLEALGKVLSETSYYHSSRLSVPQLQALLGPVLQWDEAQLFPLFDVLRVVAIHPGGAETLVSTELKSRLLNVFHRALTLIGSAEGEISFATVLTATRFVCNAVKMETLRSV
eukprot:gene17669-20125_t